MSPEESLKPASKSSDCKKPSYGSRVSAKCDGKLNDQDVLIGADQSQLGREDMITDDKRHVNIEKTNRSAKCYAGTSEDISRKISHSQPLRSDKSLFEHSAMKFKVNQTDKRTSLNKVNSNSSAAVETSLSGTDESGVIRSFENF